MTELRVRWRTFAILQDKHSINFLFKEIIAELKQAIVNAWQQLSQAFIDTSINEWCHRFSCVIRLITTNILTVHVVSCFTGMFPSPPAPLLSSSPPPPPAPVIKPENHDSDIQHTASAPTDTISHTPSS